MSDTAPAGGVARLRRALATEAVWVAAGQGVAALGALVGVRLLTEALPPTAYGELALAMSGVTFIQQTLQLPIQGAALRFLTPAREGGYVAAYVAALRWMVARSAAIVAVVSVLVVATLWAAGLGRIVPVVAAAAAFVVMLGVGSAVDGVQNAARRRRVTAWHDTLSSWSRFLLAVLFVRLTGSASSAVAMLGYAASALVTLVSQTLVFPPRLSAAAPAGRDIAPNAVPDAVAVRGDMLQFARPLGLFGLSFALQLGAERWSLGVFASTSAVGEYAVLVQLGYYPIVTLSNLLVQLATPIVFTRAGDGRDATRLAAARQLTWKFLGLVAALTVGLSAGAAVLHDQVFRVFVAPEYRGVSRLLPLVVLSAGLLACGQVAALTLMAGVRTRALVAPKLATGAMTALGSVIGARAIGVAGVVVAAIVSSAVYCAWVIALARRRAAPSPNAAAALARPVSAELGEDRR